MSEESFTTAWSGRTAIVAAAGEIDVTNATRLRDAIVSALDAGATGCVVDLTAVTFLDSAGITALVRASRRADASEAALRLAVTAQGVLRVLDLVGLDRVIPVYPGVAQALASLSVQETVMDSSTQVPSGPDATAM